MCGIAGIYGTAATDPRVLRDMAQRLAHRGPDHQGIEIDDDAGLAHTRLSIIDLGGGDQPLHADDGRLSLIANGEIYNYVELRAELERRGRRFATGSDCETILHAYAEYGDAFLDRLHGMFAFALHDRARRRLILARDRLGIKPLFLARLAHGWAFASEPKALAPLVGKPTVDPHALAQYLQCQFSTGRRTLWSGIERLLPGEALTLDAGGGVTRRRYWSPQDIRPAATGFDDAAARFDELMRTVMVEHMRSDVPFGLFLSGGLDSSLLLALLSRLKGEPIRTFSVGFADSPRGTELDLAERLARDHGSRHTVLRPTGRDMLDRLALSVWAADELMRDFANLPTLMLAETAGAELKVVFSGEGGDEVFGGYRRYRGARLERWLKNLLQPGSGGFRTTGNFRGLERGVFGAALREAARGWRQEFIAAWQSAPRGWSELQRMQLVDIATALPDNLLVKADRLLMAFGVEGRVPLLDHRVVEFGLALPDTLKIAPRHGKEFLRRWAQRYLPAEHLRAPKRGFTVPMDAWLKGETLDRLERILSASPAIREWFRPRAVHLLAEKQRRGRNVTRNLGALLQFALWHRIFVEGDGSRPALQDPLTYLA
ncbi:MAG: asparagine synthase (glutamine-hydrolyzing) [Gammaproteobacteria bacterium]|nr:asparagine synthase (glutamine-hydrolyzing) [Gammaproteobacteria bacterium]